MDQVVDPRRCRVGPAGRPQIRDDAVLTGAQIIAPQTGGRVRCLRVVETHPIVVVGHARDREGSRRGHEAIHASGHVDNHDLRARRARHVDLIGEQLRRDAWMTSAEIRERQIAHHIGHHHGGAVGRGHSLDPRRVGAAHPVEETVRRHQKRAPRHAGIASHRRPAAHAAHVERAENAGCGHIGQSGVGHGHVADRRERLRIPCDVRHLRVMQHRSPRGVEIRTHQIIGPRPHIVDLRIPHEQVVRLTARCGREAAGLGTAAEIEVDARDGIEAAETPCGDTRLDIVDLVVLHIMADRAHVERSRAAGRGGITGDLIDKVERAGAVDCVVGSRGGDGGWRIGGEVLDRDGRTCRRQQSGAAVDPAEGRDRGRCREGVAHEVDAVLREEGASEIGPRGDLRQPAEQRQIVAVEAVHGCDVNHAVLVDGQFRDAAAEGVGIGGYVGDLDLIHEGAPGDVDADEVVGIRVDVVERTTVELEIVRPGGGRITP